MNGFDPAALQSLSATLEDEDNISSADSDDLWRIVSAEVRRRCAALKLAARIVGLATADSAQLDDAQLLHSLHEVMQRLSELRNAALPLLGVNGSASDFPVVFNALTQVMLDVVTEEWKWQRVAPDRAHRLSIETLSRLLAAVIQIQPERFERQAQEQAAIDLPTLRRLSVLEATPKLYGLANLFDYYQADTQAMLSKLLAAVTGQAEHYANLLAKSGSTFAQRAIWPRLYGISTGLLCEVYKASAYRDVLRLREMPELDRSVRIAQYQRLGGMPYAHVLDSHQQAMQRMWDSAEVILESAQPAP